MLRLSYTTQTDKREILLAHVATPVYRPQLASKSPRPPLPAKRDKPQPSCLCSVDLPKAANRHRHQHHRDNDQFRCNALARTVPARHSYKHECRRSTYPSQQHGHGCQRDSCRRNCWSIVDWFHLELLRLPLDATATIRVSHRPFKCKTAQVWGRQRVGSCWCEAPMRAITSMIPDSSDCSYRAWGGLRRTDAVRCGWPTTVKHVTSVVYCCC